MNLVPTFYQAIFITEIKIIFKGLKIVGGHASPLLINQLCAFVVKLRKDSIADTIGRLQLYDEVVKWNGKLLRGLAFDEVYSIITKTQQDNQVELIVERLIEYYF